MNFSIDIQSIDASVKSALQHKIDTKTKPLGALGRLEQLALQIGSIQQTLKPTLKYPHLLVFAADHGIAREGVSAYPQEVTYQMVLNFLSGGAAINVFAGQHGLELKIIDAGVNHDFGTAGQMVDAKVGLGTKSFLHEPAMSAEECERALKRGTEIAEDVLATGCNVMGFGEMGIGNTSSAAVIMHLLTGIELTDCIGRGTGVDTTGYGRKREVLELALKKNGRPTDPLDVLSIYGGFEIAMMCGAMMKAASKGAIVLVDGFIATSAFLVASKLQPTIREYAIFCHQSDEKGHRKILEHLDAAPLLQLSMRLGEGSGCAVAYPIVESAVKFLNEMASFESAGVSNKD